MGDATSLTSAVSERMGDVSDLGPSAFDEDHEEQLGSIESSGNLGSQETSECTKGDCKDDGASGGSDLVGDHAQENDRPSPAQSIKPEGNKAGSSPANGVRKAPPKESNAREKRNSLGSSKGSPAAASNNGSPAATSNPRLKASRSNFTVPQPFSLTTEKRATLAGSAGTKSSDNNGVPTPTRTPLVIKKVVTPVQCKPNASSSTEASAKAKAEFVFRSNERAQKRMEFYAHLSEKTKAREAERNQIQVKTQQQVAAEIKKLRKDQTFKATPMPKFYQEPPPVRVDVKKTPPTRPKSPKLGRRGSNGSGNLQKIFARRSSDEYEINKKPAEVTEHLKSIQEPVEVAGEDGHEYESIKAPQDPEGEHEYESIKAPHDPEDAHDYESIKAPHDPESEESKHSSLAAETVPLVEEKPLHVEESSEKDEGQMLETSRSSGQSFSVTEEFDGIMQLPVSSSLLDGDDDDDFGAGSDFENDGRHSGHGSDLENDQFSPGSEQDENVRVYISEEFRQAAEVHEFPEEYEDDEGEADYEDDDDSTQGKIYVNVERNEGLKQQQEAGSPTR